MAKASKVLQDTAAKIEERYVDYVLTHDAEPRSVYDFSKSIGIEEAEFYRYYSSFQAIEKAIWSQFTTQTIMGVTTQDVWTQYTSREKMLSFFYALVELLKTRRSFVVYTLRKHPGKLSTPPALADAKNVFMVFAESVIHDGLDSKELADRKYISKKYKDGLWIQYLFIVRFWAQDSSANFEKTDEAIEKGVNVAFDLFQQSTVDNLLDYGKFLFRNSGIKEKIKW